jgi:succinyl-CoA synthetase beta subunit
MRLFEYQGKDLFSQYGIRIPTSYVAESLEEARKSASKLGYPVVLKSQLSVGGRGKAGAILKCNNEGELVEKFSYLLTKAVNGELPRGILVEEMVEIKKEFYLSLFLDRTKRSYSLLVSTEGGIDIEKAGNKTILNVPIDGISNQDAEDIGLQLGMSGNLLISFEDFAIKLSKLMVEKEAELAEVNPAAILNDGSLIALDSKVIIDDNSLFRHPELKKFQHVSELEAQAEKSGFSLVELEGDIAIIGNGAGLVMSTLDMVSEAGGKAGAFLDFGGSATTQTIYEAIKVISKIKRIEAVVVNLFGGIVKTNLVAQAIVDAYKNNLINVPVFARISGAESDKAKDLLMGSQAKLFDSIEDAITSAVDTVKED